MSYRLLGFGLLLLLPLIRVARVLDEASNTTETNVDAPPIHVVLDRSTSLLDAIMINEALNAVPDEIVAATQMAHDTANPNPAGPVAADATAITTEPL